MCRIFFTPVSEPSDAEVYSKIGVEESVPACSATLEGAAPSWLDITQ